MRNLAKARRFGALLLAAAAVLSLAAAAHLRGRPAYGAQVDAGKACSLTIDVDMSLFGESREPDPAMAGRLSASEFDVTLYRTASIDAVGLYTPEEGFESALEGTEAIMQASEWSRRATACLRAIDPEAVTAAGGVDMSHAIKANREPDYRIHVSGGKGRGENLEQGLYLVVVEGDVRANDGRGSFRFMPGLVSLPDNRRQPDGSGDNVWIYDASIGLKPDEQPLYGPLVIEKNLINYNQSLGETTFTFLVEGRLDGELIYSNAQSMKFEGPGTKSITLGNFPAGTVFTVTEVPNASYDPIGDSFRTTTIVPEGDENPATAAFENEWNGRLIRTRSATNHLTLGENGNITIDRREDSTADSGAHIPAVRN